MLDKLPPPQLPSNREFGLFFAALSAAVSAYAYWKDSLILTVITLVIAILFAVVVFISPKLLSPLNRFWYGFGMILGKIVSPIVLGIIFFLLITPVSLATRFFGRDALRIKKRYVRSYWIAREPVGPPPDSFKNQF